jgi:hypothetical protein
MQLPPLHLPKHLPADLLALQLLLIALPPAEPPQAWQSHCRWAPLQRCCHRLPWLLTLQPALLLLLQLLQTYPWFQGAAAG